MKSKVHWNGGTACGGNKVLGFFYILLWSSLFVACQLSTEYWCGVHDLLNIFAVFLQCLSRQCRCGVAVVPPVYHLPGYACRNPGTDREGLCDSDRLAPDFSDDLVLMPVFIWVFICDSRLLSFEQWSTSHTGLILCLWRCSCDLILIQEAFHWPLGGLCPITCASQLAENDGFVCEEYVAVHIAMICVIKCVCLWIGSVQGFSLGSPHQVNYIRIFESFGKSYTTYTCQLFHRD